MSRCPAAAAAGSSTEPGAVDEQDVVGAGGIELGLQQPRGSFGRRVRIVEPTARELFSDPAGECAAQGEEQQRGDEHHPAAGDDRRRKTYDM